MDDRGFQADETPILGDDDRVRLNRAWWDERVAAHLAGQFYDIDGFLAGSTRSRFALAGRSSSARPTGPITCPPPARRYHSCTPSRRSGVSRARPGQPRRRAQAAGHAR
jgi:hypothetical protein